MEAANTTEDTEHSEKYQPTMPKQDFKMEQITQEEGLILWIPENPDKKKIKKALQSELKFIKKSNCVPQKEDIIKCLERAIIHFGAYPNRLLRFYPDGFSWQNPTRPLKIFMYRYNPKNEQD